MPRLGKRKLTEIAAKHEKSLGSPRLADIVMMEDHTTPPIKYVQAKSDKAWSQWIRHLQFIVNKGNVIAADNVSACFYKDMRNVRTFNVMEDFPFCVPPFAECFVEFKSPGNLVTHAMLPRMWGWSVTRDEFRPEDAPYDIAGMHNVTEDMIREGVARAKWIVRANLAMVADQRDVLIGPSGSVVFILDKDGKPCVTPYTTMPDFPFEMSAEHREEATTFVRSISLSLLMTFSFMNCKNVTTPEVKPSRELDAIRRARGNPPMRSYRVINVTGLGVPKKDLGTSGSKIDAGAYIQRGHFAHYTEERKLFGKLSGRFWISDHVRGDKAKGEIIHKYNVTPSHQEMNP